MNSIGFAPIIMPGSDCVVLDQNFFETLGQRFVFTGGRKQNPGYVNN